MDGRRAQTVRRLAVAVGLGLVVAAASALPGAQYPQRLGIDVLIWLGDALGLAPRTLPERSPIAVIAIEEGTYRELPFAGLPKVAWTPQMAQVILATAIGGAASIGLDVIYPTTLDRPDLLPNYDRAFRRVLMEVGREGRLVLGFAQGSEESVRPDDGQVLAVGEGNLRPLNLLLDSDTVVRRYPAGFLDGERMVPSFAAELVARAGGTPSTNAELIDFSIDPDAIPVYGLADLWRCAAARDLDFFREEFAGRIVLIGSVLDVEDRYPTARRLLAEVADGGEAPRCTEGDDPPPSMVGRRTMPGVLIHATAALTMLLDRAPRLPPMATVAAASGSLTAVLAFALFALAPGWGMLLVLGMVVAAVAAAVVAFAYGLVLPVLPIAAAGALAYAVVYAYRFVIEDRIRRRVVNAFRHYLAPSLVERLAETAEGLRLGGETRPVTIAFFDIVGFTTLSEKLAGTPELLVEVVNGYLSVVVGVIERHGGYVDKFIGDAVMAVWGAPLDDHRAAERAVEAALDAQAALDGFNETVVRGVHGLPGLGTRIGINSGPAVVGNVGSATRLNYTVLGDPVNLASRLEGANKAYGTRIMIGETTRRALPAGRYLLRRLDKLVVKGKGRPVRVYEVAGRSDEATDEAVAAVRRFHHGLALYYRRRFADAAALFDGLSEGDEAARLYRDRARSYAETPPPDGWDRSFALDTK